MSEKRWKRTAFALPAGIAAVAAFLAAAAAAGTALGGGVTERGYRAEDGTVADCSAWGGGTVPGREYGLQKSKVPRAAESVPEDNAALRTQAAHRDISSRKTMYGIGSVSKVITAAAVMKLHEEGTIDLDQPLINYLPEFRMDDPRYGEITPRMLLDHSSGLPGGTLTNAMLLGDPDPYNHDTILQKLQIQRLKAAPGELQVYCNDGYTLAELLVERATGESFTDYIGREFAGPLGLSCLGTPQSSGIWERLADVYDGPTGVRLPPEAANVIGSGGIYATAEELCCFSQLFMENQGRASGLLSQDSVREMTDSRYEREWNPEKLDSNLSFGLGWDSVNAYPFNRYRIRALVKGGDTSFYHAGLTVLPEENISCAVLAVGGNGEVCQIAAQEILLAYLDEIGRIDRNMAVGEADRKTGREPGREPADAHAGWYAGIDMLQVTSAENGGLRLRSVGTGRERTQTYTRGEDGWFHSTGADYIDSSGRMARGNNGRVGRTSLEFVEAENGRTYLMAAIRETYPGLGENASYLPLGERIEKTDGMADGQYVKRRVLRDERNGRAAGGAEADEAVDSPGGYWEEADGKEYYLVSEKYTSTAYLNGFMVKPLLLREPYGYLTFEGAALGMAELKDGENALFFGQVPGLAGRDLSDYRIRKAGGKIRLETGSSSYLSEECVEPLPMGAERIVIEKEGEALWFRCGAEAAEQPVLIGTPAGGAWYVYDHTGREMKCVYHSWADEGEKEFYLPKDGRIVFVGKTGAEFHIRHPRVTAHTPAPKRPGRE